MALQRYLVLVYWASGSRTAYCAAANDEQEAISFPTAGRRERDVTSAVAFEWPEDLGGPRAPSEPRAYRLKSEAFVEKTLYEMGITSEAAPPAKHVPKDDRSSNPRSVKKADPSRQPLALPWRR